MVSPNTYVGLLQEPMWPISNLASTRIFAFHRTHRVHCRSIENPPSSINHLLVLRNQVVKMSSSVTFHKPITSSSRIPSVSGTTTTINRSSLRYHNRPSTYGGLKFSIKTAVSSTRIGCFAGICFHPLIYRFSCFID